MAQNEGVYVFPDAMAKASGIDPNLLLALQNNGGFGGNGNWIWILFLWLIWGNNGWGGNGFGGNNGTGYLANQISNSEGRDLLLQAINGRADALGQLASITNTGVETIKNGIFALQNGINQVGANVGLTAAQTQNAIAMGDASLSRQLCECCCNMRYELAQQTNALQAQAANNFAASQLQAANNQAATQLQMANIESADQLAVCQQTNALTSQADRNANAILGAINAQTVAMNDKFCELKERELQNKIDTQGDIITQLRNQISNDHQTLQFNAAFHALDDKIDAIAAKQPQTVPVQWPNLVAANATPYVGGYGYGGYGNGFGGGIVF
jgi:hypothetical protein